MITLTVITLSGAYCIKRFSKWGDSWHSPMQVFSSVQFKKCIYLVLSSLTIVNILEKTIHTQRCLMYWWPILHICLVSSINISSHINNIIFGTGVTPMSQGSQNDVTLEDSLTRSRETNCSKNTQIFWCCALFCLRFYLLVKLLAWFKLR